MADLPDTNNKTNVNPNRRSTTSTPRWVKVFGIIALVLILVFVFLPPTGNNLGCPPPGSPHTPPGCPGETPSGDARDTPHVMLVAVPPVEFGVQQI